MVKTAATVDLPGIALDPASQMPWHLQIYNRLRRAVLDGALKTGSRLPSTRSLADELGVSRTTTLAAYAQLLAEGYIEGRVGAGTRVAAVLPDALLKAPPTRRARPQSRPAVRERTISVRGQRMSEDKFGPELRIASQSWRVPFRVAVPALDAVPFDTWARLVSRHARRVDQAITDYQDARGLKRLRAAIAAHLSVTRGLRCTADQVLVTAGAQGAIDLAVRVLMDPGQKAVVEDPSHLGIRGALKAAGAEVVPVPVDNEGLIVSNSAAFRCGARLAFVTPSNQFPLAFTMSLSRRLALLNWATQTKAWILEDDYDSEFRFVGRPIEALQALDRDGRVLYVGSFSKVLFPGIRLGYLVAPNDLVDVLASARRFIDVQAPVLLQAALADFIDEGHFGRHIRRMRVLYRERGRALKDSFDRHLKGAITMVEPQAGMHAIGWLPAETSDAAVSSAAAAAGIEARPLSYYSVVPGKPGLVLGFGTLPPKEIDESVRKFTRIFEAVLQVSGRRRR